MRRCAGPAGAERGGASLSDLGQPRAASAPLDGGGLFLCTNKRLSAHLLNERHPWNTAAITGDGLKTGCDASDAASCKRARTHAVKTESELTESEEIEKRKSVKARADVLVPLCVSQLSQCRFTSMYKYTIGIVNLIQISSANNINGRKNLL